MTERVSVFDAAGDLAGEFIEQYPKTAAKLEDLRTGEVLDLTELAADLGGAPEFPVAADAALWAAWERQREVEHG